MHRDLLLEVEDNRSVLKEGSWVVERGNQDNHWRLLVTRGDEQTVHHTEVGEGDHSQGT